MVISTIKEIHDQRRAALQTFYQEGDSKSVTTIQFSDIARHYLAEMGIYPPRIMTLTGNALQRQAQREYNDIIERAAASYHATHKEVYKEILSLNMHLLELGVDCTLEDAIAQAHIIHDACYTIIENREAIARGALEAVQNTATYAKEHPIETALTIIAPTQMATYRASSIALHTLGYTYKRLSQVDYKNLTPEKLLKKFEKLHDDFAKVSTADKFRMGTALGVQIALDGKITQGLNKGVKIVARNLAQKAKSLQWSHTFALASKAHQKMSVKGEGLVHFTESQSITQKNTPQLVRENLDTLSKEIKHPVITSKRVGSALKKDAHHIFNDIVDNYARYAQEFDLPDYAVKTTPGLTKKLYQIEGSLDGKNGIFEWIVEYYPNKDSIVSHRRFIENIKITGIPNADRKKKL